MRDLRIDLLRFIGLMMIILAHSVPPVILAQIRNFDVPLMVFISGISYVTSESKDKNYNRYLIERIARLVLPVWVFLTFYFLCLNFLNPQSNKLEYGTVLRTYLFIDGIGFVWIFRVFILMAILAPLLNKLNSVIHSTMYFLITIISLLLFSEVMVAEIKEKLNLIGSVIYYIIPYAVVFILGIRSKILSKKKLIIRGLIYLTIYFGIFFCYYFSKDEWVLTQEYKYPPSVYYLSYAMGVTYLLLAYSQSIVNHLHSKILEVIQFISKNSMWIYLWHIFVISFASLYLEPYWFRYLFTVIISVFIVFLQVMLINRIASNIYLPRNFKVYLLKIFTG